MKRLPLLSFVLLLVLGSISPIHAAEERIVTSRSGVLPLTAISVNGTLSIKDQWYDFMQVPANTWGSVFGLRSYNTQVMLRFDDKKQTHFTAPCSLKVTYTIKVYDISGYTASSTTYTSQEVEITYDPVQGTTYRDKQLVKYDNSLRGDVTITAITYNGSSVTTVPAIFADVYLDVQQTTDRFYLPSAMATPAITHDATNATTRNELTLYWNYIQGAESYDVEWLFIDHPEVATLASTTDAYNFKNATRVNVPAQHYTISLAYPTGVLLYRVRGVGENSGSAGIVVQGPWSWTAATSGNLSSGMTDRYNWNGLEKKKNWQYSVAFAEDGKRKEAIAFYDGSLHNRQSATILNSDENIVIGETKYDYEGRGTVSLMPTPLQNSGIKYYTNFNLGYDRSQFDEDATIGTGIALGSGNKTHEYYSTLNTSTAINNGYTPDAGGYPMTQVRLMNDGSGRVRSQGGVGYDHQLGSGHETKMYYGAPQNREVDRLFGNEAGDISHYQKNLVVDANGQTSVAYLDQEGRTIATALSGPNTETALLPLDGAGNPSTSMQTDLLAGAQNTVDYSQGIATSHKVVLVSSANELWDFDYNLAGTTSCEDCPDVTACNTCYYEVSIQIMDEYYTVLHTESTSSPSTAATKSFTYTFTSPGNYHIYKTLKIDPVAMQQYLDDYEAKLRSTFALSCLEIDPLQISPCVNDCQKLCLEEYTYTDNSGVVHYVDGNGDELDLEDTEDAATWNELITACTTACNTEINKIPSLCEERLRLLKKDMSPGGQYFDNTPYQYVTGNSGELELNPDYYVYSSGTAAAFQYNWLDANVQDDASGFSSWFSTNIQTPCSTSVSISSWADVRANWQDCWADQLVTYHPEYCLYEYFCDREVCTPAGSSDPITIAESNSYDSLMQITTDFTAANTAGYLNPLSMTGSCIAAGFANDNSGYIPAACTTGTSYTSGTDDPYFICRLSTDCSENSYDLMQKYLTQYIAAATSGDYYSIWYVMDDPDDIAGQNPLSPPAGLTADIINAFKEIQDAFTAGTLTKTQYFTSAYQFYKQLIIAKLKPSGCPYLHDENFNTLENPDDKYQIRIPRNPIYASIDYCDDPSTFAPDIETGAGDNMADLCSANCEAFADSWIEQLAGCSLSSTVQNDIRTNLIEVCKKNCNSYQPEGTSGCDDCPSSDCGTACATIAASCVGCTGSVTFYSFSDVIAYFTSSGCTTVVTHPDPATTFDQKSCNCTNLHEFASGQGLDETDAGDHAAIATALNTVLYPAPTTSYTSTDVAAIAAACSTSTALPSNFPVQLECAEENMPVWSYDEGVCSCENLSSFISAYNLPAVTSADYDVIALGINTMLNLSGSATVTGTQVGNWLTECNSGSPSLTDLIADEFPEILRCPVPGGDEPLDLVQAAQNAQCLKDNIALALSNSVQQYELAIAQKVNEYALAYRTDCLTNAGFSETFTADYTLQEYNYTLYFYDQAGTLVKTVPPEGVHVLSSGADFTAVDAYRAGSSSTPKYPDHEMITRYHYNSLQQLIDQTTPDGGYSWFLYDNIGRLVVSQDARQNAYTTDGYSFVHYDDLGRPETAGQLITSTLPTQANTGNPTLMTSWLATGTQDQVVTSTYDDVFSGTVNGYFGTPGQENLRNRVSTVCYDEDGNGTYESASHYSYDIHGNVKTLIQENTHAGLANSNQHLKKISYVYDLISGNVNRVEYSGNELSEQFHHKYDYDADNRLTVAYTSRDNVNWEKEQKQFYYPHGPMSRSETGDKIVQGTDYAYTIHGWIKGVNRGTLGTSDQQLSRDMGKDARQQNSNLNKFIGADAYGYVLGYYTDDYKAVNGSQNTATTHFAPTMSSGGTTIAFAAAALQDLFNGNIRTMVVALSDNNQSPVGVHTNMYRYDKLNRIKTADRYTQTNLASDGVNQWNNTVSNNNDYQENFTYDGNGNILTANRNGYTASGSQLMDNFIYIYDQTTGNKTNKLIGVQDGANAANYADDVDDQTWNGGITAGNSATWNYKYDAIGNLIYDHAEGIDDIEWTVNNKIKKIIRRAGYTKTVNSVTTYPANIEFVYDAMGNRIAKIVKPRNSSGEQQQEDWTITYYVRDASGNVMSVYKRNYAQVTTNTFSDNIKLSEQHIYGGSRIGMVQKDITMPVCTLTITGHETDNTFKGVTYTSCPAASPIPGSVNTYSRVLGDKLYECANHLGNVLVTVSDRKLTIDGNADGITDYYTADVVSYSDYYAFGAALPGRTGSSSADYRYGFNGKENDAETGTQDYGFRIYNPSLGKFLSVDPLAPEYPWYTPYQFAGNMPICAADRDGLEPDFKFESPGGSRNGSWDGYFGSWDVGLSKATGKPLLEVQRETRVVRGVGAMVGLAVVGTGYGIYFLPEAIGWTLGTLSASSVPAVMAGGVLYAGTITRLYYTNPLLFRNLTAGVAELFNESPSEICPDCALDDVIKYGKFAIHGVTDKVIGAIATKNIHIDIGGFGKYEDAINFSATHLDFGGNPIPNLVYGWSDQTLKSVKNGVVNLITMENAKMTDDMIRESIRVLKSGGTMRIKAGSTVNPTEFAKKWGLELIDSKKTSELFGGHTTEYTEATFKKK